MSQIRVACVQMRSGTDVSENIHAADALIREAARGGADLIATPEMTTLLDRVPGASWEKSTDEAGDPGLAHFRALARELGRTLLIGSLAIRADAGKCANRSFLIRPDGEVAARYDKIHMFDVDLAGGESYRESASYEPGEEAVIAELPWGGLGLTICYDLRFPHLHRTLAQGGARFIAIPAAFTRTTGEAHWHTLIRARAIETQCYVFAAAQGGRHEHGRETFGHSLIVSPWGEILAEAGTEPCVISAVIDLQAQDDARQRVPSLRHDRVFRLAARLPQTP